METVGRTYTGVLNIVRFNWHFYAFALVATIIVLFTASQVSEPLRLLIYSGLLVAAIQTTVTLLASHWIYDRSAIREQSQLDGLEASPSAVLVNIHAGFDETSLLLAEKFPKASLQIWDFYNPDIHTEPSIQRARNAYPPHPDQIEVSPDKLPADPESVDSVFLIFAAHEFRTFTGQRELFQEIHRILTPQGQLVVVEHLRDLPNFLAFSVGFFHFFSEQHWKKLFQSTDFRIREVKKTTPFISTFILGK